MTEDRGDESEAVGAGLLTSAAYSERDLAHGVTRWITANFQQQLADAVRGTPFTVPPLCAIACREAGMYWLPLTPHKTAAEILGLCVYDASGDVARAPRRAFPVNTAQFRLDYGDEFTSTLIEEANQARTARGLNRAAIVYKGYGIFQYDLQHVRTDEAFFRSKQWYSFAECVRRAIKELKSKYAATGDIQDAVRAYNGSGQRAEQYARDVMGLLPFCEEAAASPRSPAFVASHPDAAMDISAVAEASETPADEDDPAAPAQDEASDTADFETARLLANLGAPGASDAAPSDDGTFAAATLAFDNSRAKAFLEACRTSQPRVTYGLGKKVPFFGARPGRDFTKVDCSGFVREAIRLSTTPRAPFPDGSVNQHDWIRARDFEKSTIAAGKTKDGVVRIAFLRPQDSPRRIGHVVLISNGMTLESHGGVGPNSRAWTGSGWQAKAFVYVLARDSHLVAAEGGTSFAAAEREPMMPTPAIIGSGAAAASGSVFGAVFSTESLPLHHDELLVVKMRPEVMASGPAAPFSTMAVAPTTTGLSAVSFYERAGMIKRIVPLRTYAEEKDTAPPLPATSALMFSPAPVTQSDAGAGVSFIELERSQDAQQLQKALASDPTVLSVSAVPVRYLAAAPPRRRRAAQVGRAGIAAVPPQMPALWNLKKILWEEARGLGNFQEADDVRVAVLDTGVDEGHPDLDVEGYHWRNPDLSRPVSNKDIIGHGTHVAGTIAALIEGEVGVKGICRCRLNVWKIFDDQPSYAPGLGSYVYYVNPILYRRALAACVEAGVDVLNLSIQGRAAPDPTEQLLFEQLLAAGVTTCAAMGNERQYGNPISYPAALRGVIAVGATGLDDRVTVFSNGGNHIAVAAPGKAIWSTLPTYPGQTAFAAVIGPDGQPKQGKAVRREVNYDAWDGTSMAAPHVSGCAASFIAKNKAAGGRLTPEQVRRELMASADKVSGMNGSNFSTDYGAGRVNLFRLLQ